MAMPLLETRPRLYTADWPMWTYALLSYVVGWSRRLGALALGGLWLWWGTRGRSSKPSPAVVLSVWALVMVLADLVRPGWFVAAAAVPRAAWPHELSWHLRGPTLMPNFLFDLPDPGVVLQMASLLFVGRVLWLGMRGSRTGKPDPAE